MKSIINKTIIFLTLTALLTGVTSFNVHSPARKIKLGFISLTECAPLVVAKELGLFAKYGVDVELEKEPSWAIVRDKILNGEIDGAHCLFSLPLSVYTGIGGKAGSEMKIAMVLSNNGQACMHVELLKLWNLDNREKTIVMVTHDVEEAIFLSDRVVVMNNGPASTIKEIVDVPLPRNKKLIVHDEV